MQLKFKVDLKTIVEAILLFVVVFIVTFLICFYFMQKNFFFHPWHDEKSYQALKDMDEIEEIEIDNDEKRISGWIKKYDDTTRPLVIFCGGNAQNSSNTIYTYYSNHILDFFDEYHFLCFDYPEYGLSEGKICEESMFETTLKIYDYASALEYVDSEHIVVIGYSIGTGAATYLASQREVAGLVLIAPYDEALNLYNSRVNIFYGALKKLLAYRLQSNEYAKSVKVSPLIITSYKDEIIPYTLSVNLSKCFNDLDELMIIEDVTHNYYFTRINVLSRIQEYLKSARVEN